MHAAYSLCTTRRSLSLNLRPVIRMCAHVQCVAVIPSSSIQPHCYSSSLVRFRVCPAFVAVVVVLLVRVVVVMLSVMFLSIRRRRTSSHYRNTTRSQPHSPCTAASHR